MTTQYGININIHPHSSAQPGRPTDLNQVKDLAWVRLVFFYHAAVEPGNFRNHLFNGSFDNAMRYDNFDNCFAYYDQVIDSYNQRGVGVLLVLNQETFSGIGGRAPWDNNNSWQNYAQEFANFAEKIAQRYQHKKVAYQIWNEGDINLAHGSSSVFVAPANFAHVLDKVSAAIRRHDPDAPIVFGGLATGAGNAIQYVQQVRNALNGNLPVDAIGIHLYGQYLSDREQRMQTGWFGNLRDTLNVYMQGLDKPLWVTEIGIFSDNPLPADYHQPIADYLGDVMAYIGQQSSRIPVVIWFAWSDIMRNAGITDRQGSPKEPIYGRFFQSVRSGIQHAAPEAPSVEIPAETPVVQPVQPPKVETPTFKPIETTPEPETPVVQPIGVRETIPQPETPVVQPIGVREIVPPPETSATTNQQEWWFTNQELIQAFYDAVTALTNPEGVSIWNEYLIPAGLDHIGYRDIRDQKYVGLAIADLPNIPTNIRQHIIAALDKIRVN